MKVIVLAPVAVDLETELTKAAKYAYMDKVLTKGYTPGSHAQSEPAPRHTVTTKNLET